MNVCEHLNQCLRTLRGTRPGCQRTRCQWPVRRHRKGSLRQTTLYLAAVLLTSSLPAQQDQASDSTARRGATTSAKGDGESGAQAAIVRPPALRPGATIALVAPAGPIDDALVRRAREVLRDRGFEVKIWLPDSKRRGYLAADDVARAEMLNGAIRDPQVRAILCLRGGYGTPRILDRIDYSALRAQPKAIVGYSDITALLNAIRTKTGLVTVHGPMARELTGPRGPSPFTEQHLLELLQTTDRSKIAAKPWGRVPGRPLKALVGGVAEGRLAGGNLSLLVATLGTPYAVDTEGTILFLEDVGEYSFRIDRMLAQLRLAGKLAKVRGVVLGSFSGCGPKNSSSLPLRRVFLDYFAGLNVPVVEGFPAGHALYDHVALPLGVRARLDADSGTLTLLEPAVRVVSASSRAVDK